MEVIAAGASWALNKAPSPQKILSNLGLASLVAQSTWSDLSSKLSPNASIVLPDNAEFGGLVSRWRDWHAPQVGAVVTAFTDADVQETVSDHSNSGPISDLDRSDMRMRLEYHSWHDRVVMEQLKPCSLLKMSLSSIYVA